MLWEAGQARVAREAKERLRERFVTTRDAILAADVAVGRAKMTRGSATPAYAQGDAPERSVASQDATIARLARMFPGAVSRRVS
jgi:hypothetical protein